MTDADRSLPVYQPLRRDPGGRDHLLVAESGGLTPAETDGMAVWQIGASHPTEADLIVALADRLSHAVIGFRLYAVGSESFLARIRILAETAGLGIGELRLTLSANDARPVRCVHCRALTQADASPRLTCSGCGRTLTVRSHFSRRLGAYQGIATGPDAADPTPTADSHAEGGPPSAREH